jgi:hydroxyacyl-ACP dehydratase HTD2-like protein with hotdog domain
MRMLLLDFAIRSAGGRGVREFCFRSLAPAFVDLPIALVGGVHGDTAEVHAVDEAGRRLAQGRVVWAVDR